MMELPSVRDSLFEKFRTDEDGDRVVINHCTCPYGDVDIRDIVNVLGEHPQVTSVTKMEVSVNDIAQTSRNILADYFAGHHSLKHVTIFGLGAPNFTSSLLDGISRGPGVESLKLCCCDMRVCASSFSHLLASTTSLKKLDLTVLYDDVPVGDVPALQNACRANTSLEELTFAGQFVSRLFSCLIQNCGHMLTKLTLDNPWVNFNEVCGLLRRSQSLTQLVLEFTQLSRPDCDNLIASLGVNRSLHCLTLGRSSVISNACDLVGDMIQAANSLHRITIACFDIANAATAWDAMIRGLEQNPSVRELVLRLYGSFCSVEEGGYEDNNNSVLFRPLLARAPHINRIVVSSPSTKATEDLALALQENNSLKELQVSLGGNCASFLRVVSEGLLQNRFLKSLELVLDRGVVLDRAIYELRRNFTITNISVTGNERSDDLMQKRLVSLVARNQGLEHVDYGLSADAKIWPNLIQLVLQNEWVGPSMVFRLLTCRPGELHNDGDQ